MDGPGRFTRQLPGPQDALPGRAEPIVPAARHQVLGTPLQGDFGALECVDFAMGCFWGAERLFWSRDGVYTTAVGYAGGHTPNPSYEEVCSGRTAHAEVVRVVHDPARIAFDELLALFWEGHDPTQGMAQGADVGTQYRSAIHCSSAAQFERALASRDAYQQRLAAAGFGVITTTIEYPAPAFYYAEDMHQQYLAKNPGGYCGLGGTGVACTLQAAATESRAAD